VEKVRRGEHGEFMRVPGESPLTKSRFEWLVNSEREAFLSLSRRQLKTTRGWRIKERASTLWDYVYMNVAEEAWKKLPRWISLCRLPEMIKAGKTIRNYFWGILNAVRPGATNGALEAMKGCIQRIKRTAYGFRNKERFKDRPPIPSGKFEHGSFHHLAGRAKIFTGQV
jgi:transposase